MSLDLLKLFFFFGDAGEMLGGTPTGLLSELAGPGVRDSISFQDKVRVRWSYIFG